MGARGVAEMRLYPTESPVLELSIEGFRPEALQVAVKAGLFLDLPGVDPCGDQQIKACAALEFFTTRFAHP